MDISQKILKCFKDSKRRAAPPLIVLHGERFLQDVHHAVLSIWHPILPDGRKVVLMAHEEKRAREQRLRQQVNLQIFPRAIVLLERHRRGGIAPEKNTSTEIVIARIDDGETGWEEAGEQYKLFINSELWTALMPKRINEGAYQETIEKLDTKVEGNDNYWHLTIDAGRTLKHLLDDDLRLARRDFLDLLLKEGTEDQIIKAAQKMTRNKDIFECRRKEYPKSQNIKDGDIPLSLGRDFEIIDDFVSFLQGLRLYAPSCSRFSSFLYKNKNGRSIALLRAYQNNNDEQLEIQPFLSGVMKDFLEDFVDVSNMLNPNGKDTKEGAKEDKFLDILENTLSKNEKKAIKQASLLVEKELEKLFANGVRRLYKDQISLILKSTLAMCAHLAKDHRVHEGRPLDYSFVLGASSELWQEVDEILSEEKNISTKSDASIEGTAKLIAAHWSIFQFERVYGFIELGDASQSPLPRIRKIVRVHPPAGWSGLSSQIHQHLIINAKPCFVFNVTGAGKVSLHYLSLDKKADKVKTLVWDVLGNEIEIKDTSDAAKAVNAILNVLGRNVNQSFKDMLSSAIEEVSDACGEGAMLVAIRKENRNNLKQKLDNYVREMDEPLQKMAWRDEKIPEWMDPTLLRAMLILDGATIMYGTEQIRPRVVVYPHVYCAECKEAHAFSVVDLSSDGHNCVGLKEENKKKISKGVHSVMSGKGSKHHGAANLSVVLFKENGENPDGFQVITISADGPIKLWPQRLMETK
jgi:hypothetical protein